MGKKVISNTFTVNTIEDGTFPQQIFYRDQNNQAPSTPATSQSDAVPDGWSATPQGVGGVYRYEWVSMRIKSDGVWGAYSKPAIYAYFAEDGTSISIKGAAIEIAQGTLPDALEPYEQDLSSTSLGDIILFDETEDSTFGPAIIKRVQPFIEDEELKHFVVESVTAGDGYLIASKSGQAADEGHLYVAKEFDDSGGDYYFWQDCGRIKGDKGDDAVVYELVPDVNVINANADGTITTGDIVLHAYRVIGSERSSDVLYYFAENQGEHAQFAIDNGSWTDCSSRGNPRRQAAETYIPAASVQSATSRIRLRLLDGNNAVCGVCPDITIVRNGAQGKIGRFFYFGGEFNSEDESQTFIVNDAQAPYFEHTENGQKRYHVFNYDTNGTYTMAQMWAISSNWNNKPWEAMTDDFKYIITEALFARFAKLGSFIISGDWMLTHYGVIYDTSGTAHTIDNNNTYTNGGVTYSPNNAYLLFDANYPNSSKSSALNFCPSYCVDGLTGETYQQNAHIKGDIEATSGSFAGQLKGVNGTFTHLKAAGDKVEITTTPSGWGGYDWYGFSTTTNGTYNGDLATIGARITNTYDYGRLVLVKRNKQGSQQQIIILDAGDGTITAPIMKPATLAPTGLVAIIHEDDGAYSLPANPLNGQMIFLNGVTANAQVYANGHAIGNGANGGNVVGPTGTWTIGLHNAMLVFTTVYMKWLSLYSS